MLKNKRTIKIGDTSPINLTDGDNIGLVFDALVAGTYTIEILDGEDVIKTASNIVVGVEPEPTPSVEITDVVITDTTGEGNDDGEATANVNISNFTGQGTAVITPDPNSVSPIDLDDGDNALSYSDLPAGDYQVDIKDDDNIVDSFTFTIADPVLLPTATISNVVPTDATTNGGTDGLITFDTTIANFVGTGTATLTPASGTTPLTLTDGANAELVFDTLPAGTYTITILDGSDIITTEEDIVINEPEA